MSDAIYNEIEPFACDWLERLVAAGHIAPGRVERRSIADLTPADVAGPGQRHFFAGIGVWSYALRLAGVPDDASIWTGSCPCQPFSGAGSRRGFDDERHLWPTWFGLIRECRPAIVFGEQVASPDGRTWLDAVRSDMEGVGYAVGATDLCAAGVGAPHIRQRLFFVAHADCAGLPRAAARRERPGLRVPRGDGPPRVLADSERNRSQGRIATGTAPRSAVGSGDPSNRGLAHSAREQPQARSPQPHRRTPLQPHGHRPASWLGHTSRHGDFEHPRELRGDEGQHAIRSAHRDHAPIAAGATRGHWANAEWVPCIDGVSRPIEPGTFPLAHGAPARVGRLRGYGNAIVAQVAATFIEAALDALNTGRRGHDED